MRPLNSNKLRTARLASVNSAKFGMVRKYPNGKPKPHQGIDLVAAPGTDVFAVADGKVIGVNIAYSGYGYTLIIEIKIEDKTHYAFYAHLSKILVNVGDTVKAGQKVALTGDTGNAAGLNTVERGSHLHFELRTKQRVTLGLAGRIDPLLYVELDDDKPN